MLGEIVPSGSPSRTSIRESAAVGLAAANGGVRLNRKHPAPMTLLRINFRRPIKAGSVKSCSPLNYAVRAGGHLEFRPAPRDRSFVQRSRNHALRRFEALRSSPVSRKEDSTRAGALSCQLISTE